jgi:hypothetical protein
MLVLKIILSESSFDNPESYHKKYDFCVLLFYFI